jgi:aminoglycoside N3'-acetyltransferase
MAVALGEVRAGVRALGLSGLPLCVHSSLRSFGWVDGGPSTVVAGLLDEGCTVLVPTFTFAHEVLPPPGMRPPRNAFDYDDPPGGWPAVAPPYDPSSNSVETDMGAIPRAVLAIEGRVRGRHALDAFTATGPLAHQLVDGQTAEDVYAPLCALAAHGGWVVLMGVGLTRLTLVHWAEQLAGRQLFRRWASVPGAGAAPEVAMFAVGGCSAGFARLESTIGRLARETLVGRSPWRAFPARRTAEAAAEAIRRDPTITACQQPDCRECPDATAGGPILDQPP